MSSVSSVRKISDDLARNHLSDVDELGEDFSPPFFATGKWTWDRKMSSGSVLSDSSRRSSQDEQRKKKSSDGSLHQYLDYLGERRRSSDASVILNENTDSFIIGDRVWVGGTKPGQIAYIGETQFAPGDWAGVVLDEPIGKNDGSVANIRYFQCEAKKGVFSRLTRLTRFPILELTDITDPIPPSGSYASAEAREARRSTGSLSATPPKKTSLTLTATPKTSFSKPSSPDSALHPNVAVGDRVIVMSAQGSKAGILRYMGPTDFAPGEWCGVELDDPLGKNDGSVAGTRYFECRPKFGLFAPVHKVSRSPSSRRPSQANCQIHRRGSKESLVSATSSITSARSAAPRKVAARAPTTPTSTKNSLQDQLRSKDQHIEQLMRERELERAEITRAATQADDAERSLLSAQREWTTLKDELESRVLQAQIDIDALKAANKKLNTELEEERARNEDLLFRFEEASIEKESISAETADKLRELEREKSLATEDDQNRMFELEEELIQSKIRVTQLEEQLKKLESQETTELHGTKIKHEAEKLEWSLKHTELVKQLDNKINELELAKKQQQELQQQLQSSTGDAGQKINELGSKVMKLENELLAANTQQGDLKSLVEERTKLVAELETRVAESDKIKIAALDEKTKLEKKSHELEEALRKLEKEHSESVKIIDSHVKQVQSLENDKARLQTDLDSKMSENQHLLAQNEVKENQFKKLSGDLEKIQNELTASTKNAEKLQDVIHSLSDEKTQLLSQLTGKASTNDELIARSTGFEMQVKKLSEDLEKLGKDYAESVEELETKKVRVDGLEAEKTALENALHESSAKNAEILAKLEKMETEARENLNTVNLQLQQSEELLGTQKTRITCLEDEKTQLEVKLREEVEKRSQGEKHLTETLEKLGKDNTDSIGKLTIMQKSIQSLEAEKTNLEKLLADEQATKTELLAEREKSQNDLQKLSEGVNKLQLDVTQSVQKLSTQQERLNGLQAEKTHLESQLAEKLVANSELHAQLQAKQTELNQREKLVEKMGVENAGLSESVSSAKVEIDTLKADKVSLEEMYKSRVQGLEFRMSELEGSLSAETEKLKQTQAEKCKLELELSSFMNSSTDANAQLQAKHNELLEKDQKLQESVNEVFETRQQVLKLEQEVQKITAKSESNEKGLKDQLEAISVNLTDTVKKLQEVENVNKVLEDVKTKLEIEQASQLSTINSLTAQLEDKSSELSKKNQDVDRQRAELDSSSQLIQRQQQEMQQINEHVANLQKNISLLSNTETEMKGKIQNLVQAEQQLRGETSDEVQKLQQDIQTLVNEKQKVEHDLVSSSTTIQQLTKELESAKVEILEKSGIHAQEVENLHSQLDLMKKQLEKLNQERLTTSTENSKIIQELQQDVKVKQQTITEKEQLVDTVHTRLEDTLQKVAYLEAQCNGQRDKNQILENELKVALEWKVKFDELTAANARLENNAQRSVTNLQQELENVSADLVKYKNGYERLEKSQVEANDRLVCLETGKSELEAKVKKLTEENTELLAAKVNYELEKESLDKQLEIGNVLMSEKEKEARKLSEEMEAMQAEQKAQQALRELLEDRNRLLERRETECTTLRRENDRLQEEIRASKIRKLNESNANISAGEIPAEEQIDFLNSVIVDMQKKNEVLKARIQSLELGDSPDDYADYDLLNIHTRTVAPRLFCDICDRFDLHDTEDCPTQAMQEEDEDMPVRNPNKPKPQPPAPRPYCETCEVFGHDTADCDDAETF